MNEARTPYEGWTVLEVMGHRRLGGYVTETEIAGGGFLRIDVPRVRRSEAGAFERVGEETVATQFYRPDSVYCLTPCGEAEAFAAAFAGQPEPVKRWEIESPRLASPGSFADGDAPF